ncbi:high-potential iron-sulfur protein [Salinisphaera sp. LB1]|uniref:high-potential iron-sulfur protein n=1 Tax=Salinisphaera sp. LB1 TaxID=2183911 RepID=UPI000D706473|nr:high-potential iron-sulfur protein [Salinisphaera sp. LB1]
MKSKVENPSRRQFLVSAVRACVGTIALGFCAVDSVALAAPAKVSEHGAFAKQLHYREDATQETASRYKKGEVCANCVFYRGKDGDQYGPCEIFGGKLVNADGWCTAYRAKS